MKITQLDHLVFTVADVQRSVDFYTAVLGMEAVTFGAGRRALAFGRQKINLHPAGAEFAPHAREPRPGSADLCLLTETPLPEVMADLARHGVDIAEGPVERTGARGPILSVYVRDPDGNLLEISNLL